MADKDAKLEDDKETNKSVADGEDKSADKDAKAADDKADDKSADKSGDKIDKADPDADAERKTPWFQRRIDELTREKYEARRESENLKARLQALEAQAVPNPADKDNPNPAKTMSPAEQEAMITARAEEKARMMEFTKECNKIYESGTKAFDDFGKSLEAFNQLGGLNTPQGANLVAASMETDDPHKVLYALSKDLDEASRLMSLPPIRQAAALIKFANSLAAKPAAKSKAPPPIKGLNGQADSTRNMDDDSMDMNEWIATRERQLAERRKRAH